MRQGCHLTPLPRGRRLPTCLPMLVPTLNWFHCLTLSCQLSAITFCVYVKWHQTWHDTTASSMVSVAAGI